MLGIHTLSASLSLIMEVGIEQVEQELLKRSEYLFERFQSSKNCELITPEEPGRYAGIVTFRRRETNHASLYTYLSQHRVVCALRGGSIRFSPHFYTPQEKLDHAIELVMQYTP
jgi:selenocysteine lyase/cysteine desulfurase